ncbi:hypothetical protein TEA_027327 [Camellia sinensis var. sinensis]|uniref:Squalene cyclase N-terminal domain-containing protein n=1 Tax=Camellia sinensis var. sinensis TaxID=542762 RepID=A0A4S4EFM5_CAMSN|nr:hypothetical protein TEA_027327 [Camellia sinensis var. sinensis]
MTMIQLYSQNSDGGWGLHIEGNSAMFCTALNYVTLRLLGERMNDGDGAMEKARKWILDHGGVTHIPSWGKFWFSEDLYYPHPMIQDILWDSLHKIGEPLLMQWPFYRLRKKALSMVMEHIHYEDENTQYICLGPVNKVLNMICCWVDDPNSMANQLHLSRIKDYLWVAEDGMKMQVRNDSSGNLSFWYRHISKGGWPFSTPDNGWPVSDCTAEGNGQPYGVVLVRALQSSSCPKLIRGLGRGNTRERYIGPTHIVGLAPDLEQPHFLVAPLPLGFAERRGHAYPSNHNRTTTPLPQHVVYTPAVDFTNSALYLEAPIRITGREFWGYDHGVPVYIVQVVWSCFGIKHSGWEFESLM